jgi:hypothetical protein
MIVAVSINLLYTFLEKPVYHFVDEENNIMVFLIGGGLIFLIMLFFGMQKITNSRKIITS